MFLDLPYRGSGKFVAKRDCHGHFEPCERLTTTLYDPLFGQGGTRLRNHERLGDLVEHLVRHTDNCDISNTTDLPDRCLDFAGSDIFPHHA